MLTKSFFFQWSGPLENQNKNGGQLFGTIEKPNFKAFGIPMFGIQAPIVLIKFQTGCLGARFSDPVKLACYPNICPDTQNLVKIKIVKKICPEQ